MKPIGTNNLSVLGYVGLFILFSMPYIGTPALILFAIFGTGSARNFARALLLITVLAIALLVILIIVGLLSLSDLNYFVDGGVQVFNGIRALAG